MPHQPTVSDAKELGGLPRRLPDQNAVLVGRVRDDDEFGELAAYYVHGAGSILLGQYEDREFAPEYALECESRLPSACARAFSTVDAEIELSSIGNALVQAWHFGDRTSLSHKQAHVYSLREKNGFGREETANILNISPSTVDTHLQRATEKLVAAKTLLEFVQVDPDELATPNPEILDENDDDNPVRKPDDIARIS